MVPLRQELRVAARNARRAPLFSAAIVGTIAVAVGANTAVFSVTNAVLLRPLPFADSDRLVWIASVTHDEPNYPFSLPEFLDYREQARSLEGLAAFGSWSAIIGGSGPAERVQGVRISANAFEMLGVRPAAGRLLAPRDDRAEAPRVAVLAFETWQRQFGGDGAAIGRVALLNGEPFEIVGVLPRHFPFPIRPVEIVVPLAPERDPARGVRRSVNSLRFIGRVRPGATPQQAQAELLGISKRLRDQYPDAYAAKTGVSVRPLHAHMVRNHARALTLLTLAAVLALLIACGNLANLLLARASARSSEAAVKLALGATTFDIARSLWIETSLLSAAGGLLGVAAGSWTVRAFIRFGPADVPRLNEVALDWQVFAFAAFLLVSIATVLAVAPLTQLARAASAVRPSRDQGSSRRAARLRQAVIVMETALTAVLLWGSILLIRSFDRLQDVDPGFAVSERVVARIALPRSTYRTAEAVTRFADRFSENIAAIPGVREVGGVNVAPLSGVIATTQFTVGGAPPSDPRDAPTAHYRVVTEGYLPALGVPLVRGRGFASTDVASSMPVALINDHLAQTLFAGEDPIGRSLLVRDNTAGPRPLRIVGVVGDVRQMTLDGAPTFDIYLPMRQAHSDVVQWLANNQFWVIRAAGGASIGIGAGLRHALEAADPGAGLAHVRPLAEYVDGALAQRRFATLLSSALAGVALILVIIGLYSVTAYSVTQRTQEIGLRTAIGASQLGIWWLITRGVLGMLITGAAAGLILAAPAVAPLKAVLVDTEPFDVGLIVSVVAGLMTVGLAAAAVPAWRAARIDPVAALRESAR